MEKIQNPTLVKPLLNCIKIQKFTDRYFTRYYAQDHTYYFHHTNGLVLLGLSKKLLNEKGKVKNIEFIFKQKDKIQDMKNLVSGKKKKGGIQIQPQTKLCTIKFENGEEFCLRSLIRGKIIEINEFLIDNNYQIINNEPEDSGYLFILALPYNEYTIDKDYKDFVKVEADKEYNQMYKKEINYQVQQGIFNHRIFKKQQKTQRVLYQIQQLDFN